MRERLIELLDGFLDLGYSSSHVADYLLSNGVIVPPCKVGDTLYVINDELLWETKVVRVVIRRGYDVTPCIVFVQYKDGSIKAIIGEDSFGKTVFLTREEAERALKGGERDG